MSKQQEAIEEMRKNAPFNAIIEAAVNEYRVLSSKDDSIIPMSDTVARHVTEKLRTNLLPTLQALGDKITTEPTRQNLVNRITTSLRVDGTKKASLGNAEYTIKEVDIKNNIIPILKTVIEPAYSIVRDSMSSLVRTDNMGNETPLDFKIQNHMINKLMSTVGPVLNKFAPSYLESANDKLVDDIIYGMLDHQKKGSKFSVETTNLEALATTIAKNHEVPNLLAASGITIKIEAKGRDPRTQIHAAKMDTEKGGGRT